MNRHLKKFWAAGCMMLALSCNAIAAEVAGVKMEDSFKVANVDLKLNGAGVRTRAIFKVYVAGLYLPEKKTTVAEILALPGPRRMKLVMMREVSGDDFGASFMTGLNNNADSAEKKKLVNQIQQFGEIFNLLPSLKKDDVLYLDWIPGPKGGTQSSLNGKPLGELIPDQLFYNAVLKIWLGDKPADSSLKPQLLGGAH